MARNRNNQFKSDRNSGKTILNSLLIFLVILAALILIGFNFFKSLLPRAATSSPIENAALVAARDLSKIVVNTEEFGYISIASQPADGSMTVCEDGYSLPVRSINEIIATIRLDLIIADKLEQPLMKEFALKDYKNMLKAKDRLTKELKEAIKPTGSSRDKSNNEIKPYHSAEEIIRKALNNASKKELYKKGALVISLGSLQHGLATNTPIPIPASRASLKENQIAKGSYLSYTNLPYQETNFVFGGVSDKEQIIDPSSWIETAPELAYQIPTILKLEFKHPNKKSSDVACVQPADPNKSRPKAGAFTMSFPDGPVPEIKRPIDLYLNKQLNNPELEPMKLTTARGGDYPVDSGSYLEDYKWPINEVSNWEPSANVVRLALYDWIRRAGPTVNIDSLSSLFKIELDTPRPANLLWKAPLIHGGPDVTLQPISSGIVHIFEFEEDGIVAYRSKIIMPYPIYPSSNNQLFGQGIAAITFSDIGEKTIHLPSTGKPRKIILKAAWDMYIRDSVRTQGPIQGGKHAGEPIAMPVLSSRLQYRNRFAGNELPFIAIVPVVMEDEDESTARIYNKGKRTGYQPTIAPQSDLGENTMPPPPYVRPLPYGRGKRPLYAVNGSSVDIRLRRQIDVSELNGELSTGYFGIVQPDN